MDPRESPSWTSYTRNQPFAGVHGNSRLQNKAKAIIWAILVNQIYLYDPWRPSLSPDPTRRDPPLLELNE